LFNPPKGGEAGTGKEEKGTKVGGKARREHKRKLAQFVFTKVNTK